MALCGFPYGQYKSLPQYNYIVCSLYAIFAFYVIFEHKHGKLYVANEYTLSVKLNAISSGC